MCRVFQSVHPRLTTSQGLLFNGEGEETARPIWRNVRNLQVCGRARSEKDPGCLDDEQAEPEKKQQRAN